MATVNASITCLRCNYQLRGAPTLGFCPECGLSVAASLASSFDPSLRSLAPLHSPRLLAAAVMTNAVAILVCVASQLGAPMLMAIDSMTNRVSLFPVRLRLLAWIASACVLTVAGIMSHIAISRGEAHLRMEFGRWRFWFLLGTWLWMAGTLLISAAAWNASDIPSSVRHSLSVISIAIQLPGMAIMLSGFSVLLAITGRRSQAYREAGAARQSVHLLNINAGLLVGFGFAAPILRERMQWDFLAMMTQALTACMAALLLFGSAYLVANAWWICKSLRTPLLTMEEFLDEP